MSAFEEKLEELIKELKPEIDLDMAKSPDALGFDSLDFVELEMAIEDEYGVEVEDLSKFYKLPLHELAHYVEHEISNGG